jgi:FHA domain
MTDVSYVPGEWTAIAGDRCWALIDAAPDSATVREIWQRIEDDAGLYTLMAGLLCMGLGDVPGFALLATRDGGSHLICRGHGSATVIADGTSERVAGTGLLTWREHAVAPSVACVVLGDSPVGTDLQLPASTGVFLAQSVTIALAVASNRRPEAAAVNSQHRAVPEISAQATETSARAAVTPAASVSDVGATLTYPVADDWIPDDDAGSAARVGASQEGSDTGPVEEAGYDFLFGATQARTVEDAAIRPAADDDLPLQLPAVPSQEPQAAPVLQAEPRGRPARPAAIKEPGAPVASGGLIDAVPWALGPDELSPGGTPAPPARPLLSLPDSAAGPEDDNGATVRRENVLGLSSRAVPSDRIGPTVHALLCPSSHASPPSSSLCRVCGVPLPQQDPVTVPRPVLGALRLSTGDVITLDRGVVMGRNPRTDFDGEERPHIVKVPSGDGEISRTHLQVSLDGWHVLVTDLKSTNGTLVALPGRDPERLRPGEPFPIQPGTVVTLADDIYFRYEATQ